jgi:hypothetical protein
MSADVTALDGNAIAGTLWSVFGAEMTAAVGTCGNCGDSAPLAELRVYLNAPGIVARCRECATVLLVIVHSHGVASVDVSGFAAFDGPGVTPGAVAGT